MDQEEIKSNLKQSETWTRLIYMIILYLAFKLAELIVFAVIVLQFCSRLVSGSQLQNLDSLANNLATYIKNILLYLSYTTEKRPFPFSDWQESIK